MNEPMTKADFRLFLVLWNQRQNFKTPLFHLTIAMWLEGAWSRGDKRLLLMAFRSAGKSSIVGVFAAWLIYTSPDIRILVLAADAKLAGKMVRNVKRTIERHPLTKGLKPKSPDQWASDRFTVNRDTELRDPSMIAHGVTSNITGSRADIVICDDVEVPNTCDSAEKRENLRTRLSEIPYILVAGGTQLYVGTPHTYFSIYADVPRTEIGEEREFLGNFKRLSLPIITNKGESAWPERYDMDEIENIKTDAGPNKFESQMMLRPVNIMEGRLDADLLQFYSADVEYVKELGELFIGHQKVVAATCWWDPALAKNGGDNSVVAVVYGDEGGNYYVQHVEYIKLPPITDDKNSADEQCDVVEKIVRRFYLPFIAVEDNGLAKFLPGILRTYFGRKNTPCRVQDVHNRKAKAQRILEGFDALLAAKRLYVHSSVQKTPFVMEMREWRPESAKGHDDGLDAVAGALSLHPDRLERCYGRRMPSWMRGNKTHKVTSDFKV
ncbi:MAG: phage terminase large subunit [Alphaproteobacteria bacterium]